VHTLLRLHTGIFYADGSLQAGESWLVIGANLVMVVLDATASSPLREAGRAEHQSPGGPTRSPDSRAWR